MISFSADTSFPVDKLLRMEAMYNRRERRLTLRKEFENEMWQQSSIVGPVLDHYVLVSGGGVRVSDVTRGEGV